MDVLSNEERVTKQKKSFERKKRKRERTTTPQKEIFSFLFSFNFVMRTDVLNF